MDTSVTINQKVSPAVASANKAPPAKTGNWAEDVLQARERDPRAQNWREHFTVTESGNCDSSDDRINIEGMAAATHGGVNY